MPARSLRGEEGGIESERYLPLVALDMAFREMTMEKSVAKMLLKWLS